MADFSNFELGDNVAALAGGLLPEMANVFEIELGDAPNSQTLGALVGAIGAKKTLRENETGAKAWLTQVTGSDEQAFALAADWLERSGVQQALDRSLWTPELTTPEEAAVVATGGVANWQDRTAELITNLSPRQVHIATGTQVMNSVTEKINPNVITLQNVYGTFPTQQQYAEDIILPQLLAAGHEVVISPYDTQNGEEIAQRFVADYSRLLSGPLAFARVANAGIQLAVQFRNAARRMNTRFDTNPNKPQAFVLTDSFPIARTLDEAAPKNAKDFQSPFTGIRQVALTGKLLVEAAEG